jgi:hypothetical protein
MQDQPDSLTVEVFGKRGGIPLSLFIVRVRGLLRGLVELDAHLSEDRRGTRRWMIVEASYNSPLRLRVESKPIRGRTPKAQVAKLYVEGVKMIEEGAGAPPYFTPKILKITKRVLRTKSRTGGGIAISDSDGHVVRSTYHVVRVIDEILRQKPYREHTTLEGKLDAINIHDRMEFNIYDILTDGATKCYFDPDLFSKAYGALGRRVAVTGEATYNREDEPISMKVDDIQVVGDRDDLPFFREGEEIDITGGVDSVEYIRRARDAE